MTIEELHQIIEKYHRLSDKFYPEQEEKSVAYNRFADFLTDYPRHSGLTDSDTEEDLWEHFKFT